MVSGISSLSAELKVFAALLVFVFLSATPTLAAAKIKLQTGITGYEVSYGTTPGRYTNTIDVGLKTKAVIPDLREGVTYYVVVRAYNKRGLKSAPSGVVKYRRGAPFANVAPDGEITAPSTSGTIVAGQSVDFSAGADDPNGDPNITYRWDFGQGSGIPDGTGKNPAPVRFNVPGTYRVTLTATDPKGLADPTPASRTITVLSAWSITPRSGWKLKYVNSEEPNGYAATQSFDGDPNTFWHTRWSSGNLTPPPHQIQIDLGSSRTVKGFQYLPRQDGFKIGTIARYEFYVSKDGNTWGKPVSSGVFSASTTEKRVFTTPKKGRFVRLVGLSEANGTTDCSVAELNILQGPPANRKPAASGKTVRTHRNKTAKVKLKGSDADDNPLTYQIVSRPEYGTLKGNPPNLSYKPDKKFTGTDRFTYRIHDGLAYSKTVTVTIKVVEKGNSAKESAVPLAAAVVSRNAAATDDASTGIATDGFNKAPSANPLIGSEIIGGLKYLTLTASKASSPDGLKHRVEVSSNLVDWFSGGRHTTVLEDNERFLKVRDNTPLAPGRKRHIRLKTTRR